MSSCIPYKQRLLEDMSYHIGLTLRHHRIRYRHIHRKGQNLSKQSADRDDPAQQHCAKRPWQQAANVHLHLALDIVHASGSGLGWVGTPISTSHDQKPEVQFSTYLRHGDLGSRTSPAANASRNGNHKLQLNDSGMRFRALVPKVTVHAPSTNQTLARKSCTLLPLAGASVFGAPLHALLDCMLIVQS